MALSTETATLLGKIYDRKVVLFIGNGASVDAGGPKTEELVREIKKHFLMLNTKVMIPFRLVTTLWKRL